MSFLQPWMLLALPVLGLPILIHLINQWRYQTKQWGAMMFLLQASRMNRGLAKLRQWLILALRTLALAGLILAVSRPLSSGLLGWNASGEVDTTIILFDRSPSMQVQASNGQSKLEAGRQQLASALTTLGSRIWLVVDSSTAQVHEFDNPDALLESTWCQPVSASSNLPRMLEASLEYITANTPATTDIWICSDLRQSDWKSDSGQWSLIRQQFQRLPQAVRFHLLAYPDNEAENLAVRGMEVRQVTDAGAAESERLAEPTNSSEGVPSSSAPESVWLELSFEIARTAGRSTNADLSIPIQIEIEGTRIEMDVEMTGDRTVVRDHRIPLPQGTSQGWGRVTLPADANPADNEYYFIFDEPRPRRVVIVSDEREASDALEIAASISPDGADDTQVDVLAPVELDSERLERAALLVWQASLPDETTVPTIEDYVRAGGRILFFPPAGLPTSASEGDPQTSFMGVSWKGWTSDSTQLSVENWRGDQDLLAATRSGSGLPVGELQLEGFAKIDSESPLTSLATFNGGAPMLARLPTSEGGVYFCTASVDPQASSLAEGGVVLFVLIQRAIESGADAMVGATQRVAGEMDVSDEHAALNWRQVAGRPDVLSVEYPVHAGVYRADDQLFAINRPEHEDVLERVADEEVAGFFEGLPFSRVDSSAGELSGIVSEIWRLFLILMIAALVVEALLSLPRRTQRSPMEGRRLSGEGV